MPVVTPLRLLLAGLGLLFVALLLVSSSAGPWSEPTVLSVRGWWVLVLTAVGCGLTVCAALVSALTAVPTAPAVDPVVDHYAA